MFTGILPHDGYFYPRSPCGERHDTSSLMQCQAKFLSTLSLRRATTDAINGCNPDFISIHALLAESDKGDQLQSSRNGQISIHALLAESDPKRYARVMSKAQFLSTLSLRRATFKRWCVRNYVDISIHALLAESDSRQVTSSACRSVFLSTLSLRRATPRGGFCYLDNIISIHALLAESDGIGLVFMWWGVRFLSTLSLRRATNFRCSIKCAICNFYPRSPCGERLRQFRGVFLVGNFYPRSPCGERLDTGGNDNGNAKISIHALLAESDSLGLLGWLRVLISIHALLAESDQLYINRTAEAVIFLSTLSLRRATEVNNPVLAVTSISIHALLAESDPKIR